MTKILILVGSARQGVNAELADAALEVLPTGATAEVFPDLARVPHFHVGLDESGVDEHVDALRAAVRASDALLFVVPEYNGGPTSIIKNALDVVSRPHGDAAVRDKPAAVVGATPSRGGTGHAREVMQRGIGRAGGRLVEATLGIAQAHEKLTEGGYPPEIRAELAGVLEELARAVGSAGSRL